MIKNSLSRLFRGQRSFFLMVPALVWQILFLCIPLVVIFILSFLKVQDNVTLSYSLSHYASFFKPQYLKIIFRSLLLGSINTLICLLIGYPLAYYLVFRVGRWKNTLLFLLILPFWTNLLVLAYAWFFVLDKYGLFNNSLMSLGVISEPLTLLNTPFSVYLVMIYCYLPFMVLPIYSILEKLDKRLIEASDDLGARWWESFWRVIFPLSMSGIQTGVFLVFVQSFGEFVIPELLGGGKTFYVGTLISHYFLVSRNPFAGAAFTCFSVLFLIAVAYMLYRMFKKVNSTGGVR
ncbi:ABC transporter permease [Candidatus Dependentiae bacterium]|nr:ABC transporter permease [Candidatus Dependentiae bacterium]